MNSRFLVIATKSNTRMGYLEGDVIELYKRGFSNDVFFGNNITRPKLLDEDFVTIHSNNFILKEEYDKEIKASRPKYRIMQIKETKFLGITIFKRVIKQPNY